MTCVSSEDTRKVTVVSAKSYIAAAAAALALVALPSAGQAQTASPVPDTPAAASPSAPASPPALSAICTDRPTKSSGACTVDAGHFQYEADIANATFQHLDGVTTDTYLVTNPTLKYGVTSNIDVEATLSPLEIVTTHAEGGPTHTIAGVGDLYLKLKYDFLSAYGGNLQAAIIPYVKAPTARHGIGDGSVEGGALLPASYKLNSLLTFTITPEVDDLKDSDGTGHHLNTEQLINVGVSLPQNVTVYGELWGDWNFDPTGTVRQYSADVAAAYVIGQYLQLDGGLNFGLNRYTPGVQAYVGISQKF